jgi:hypothetical protein
MSRLSAGQCIGCCFDHCGLRFSYGAAHSCYTLRKSGSLELSSIVWADPYGKLLSNLQSSFALVIDLAQADFNGMPNIFASTKGRAAWAASA